MPAHVTHLLFARDIVGRVLGTEGETLSGTFGQFLTLGAQGPDIFYHNQRTKPSGLSFGKHLHRRRYGTAVRAMVEKTVSIRGRNALFSPSGAFTIAFATHAVLDRITHPFIIYHSGWVDPVRPETHRLYQCHAFFERIIDVIMLRRMCGQAIESFDFVSRIDCGPRLSPELTDLLLSGLCAAFPSIKETALNRRRIRNAYHDALSFYFFTNPPAGELRETAKRLDLEGTTMKRRLALFHPYVIPETIDFLNESHGEWRNPSFSGEQSQESFLDLYGRACAEGERVVSVIVSALRGETGGESVETAVGNANLNDGHSLDQPAPSIYSKPLPLPELLDSLYGASP